MEEDDGIFESEVNSFTRSKLWVGGHNHYHSSDSRLKGDDEAVSYRKGLEMVAHEKYTPEQVTDSLQRVAVCEEGMQQHAKALKESKSLKASSVDIGYRSFQATKDRRSKSFP